MKRKNVLEESTPTIYEGILKVPSIGETMGAYRMSTGSNQTFATTTTRASSVMPPARPNLGTSASMNENMSAEEAREYYGNTSYGQKNQEVTGNSLLPQTVATTINQQTREAQDKDIKDRYAKEDKLKIDAERNKKKRRRYLLFILLGFIALVAIAGGVFATLSQDSSSSSSEGSESDGTNNQEEPEPDSNENDLPLPPITESPQPQASPSVQPQPEITNQPTQNPTDELDPNTFRFENFEPTSESNFEFMCRQFPQMDNHIFCQDSSYFRCENGRISERQIDCGCDCEGSLSAPFNCPTGDDSTAECNTNIVLDVPEIIESQSLTALEEFTRACEDGDTPLDLCLFTDQILRCENNKVHAFTCDSQCGCDLFMQPACLSNCANALIEVSEPLKIIQDDAFNSFCLLVKDKQNFARCQVSDSNGKGINLCPDAGVGNLNPECSGGDKCICEDGGIVFIDSFNNVGVLQGACGSSSERDSCPNFEIAVPMSEAVQLSSLLLQVTQQTE